MLFPLSKIGNSKKEKTPQTFAYKIYDLSTRNIKVDKLVKRKEEARREGVRRKKKEKGREKEKEDLHGGKEMIESFESKL